MKVTGEKVLLEAVVYMLSQMEYLSLGVFLGEDSLLL